MTANNKSKTDDKPKAGAETAQEKTAQANNEATAEAEEIKVTATAEAEQIVATANEQAENIVNDAKAEAESILGEANDSAHEKSREIISGAQTEAEEIKAQAMREADDLSNGLDTDDTVEQTGKRAYRNTGGKNLFTEGGRCRPNETVMLTDREAESYTALELCRNDNA